MPYKDPEKRREYNRAYRARKRTEARQTAQEAHGFAENDANPPEDLEAVVEGLASDPREVAKLLARLLAKIEREDCDLMVKGRTAATMSRALLETHQVGEIAERLAALEAAVEEGPPRYDFRHTDAA